MQTTNKLPDKPSELIRVALSDLAKCEADPDYAIDMAMWHLGKFYAHKCMVCLAGAVMAQTFQAPKDYSTSPSHITDTENYKLVALDNFRLGNISSGLFTMGIFHAKVKDSMDITPYHKDPAQFRANMEALADYLELKGH